LEYIDLGKIAYSNEVEFIGRYLKVSEPNYKMIDKFMNEFINKDFGGFKKCKNDFFYHLFRHVVSNIKKELIKTYSYKLFVYYSFDISFPFDLYYSTPIELNQSVITPIEIYEKELINFDNRKL
jgi:hypothetical protein